MKKQIHIKIIGAGLAGCEAANVLGRLGAEVELIDMKPREFSPAHSNPDFAELVCSNSLKSDIVSTSSGILKAELQVLNSLIISTAYECRVAAGGALAVDRDMFASAVTQKINALPNIRIKCENVAEIDENVLTIIATGPLTSNKLAENLMKFTGNEQLYFFDSASPIVTEESVDMSKAFWGSRYGKGGDDYLNCPMTKSEYELFWRELTGAESVEMKGFEGKEVFEGCMPVEVMAKRGIETLRFGPLKPVGLGEKDNMPYAVVQLRAENTSKSLFNLVGFQTNLKFGEQKRVFSLIPALRNAEFVRFGVMHRNTYINAPKCLNRFLQLKEHPNIFIAGQLSGVEGYVESTATGLICGINAYRYAAGLELISLPLNTMTGALINYIVTATGKFQPMNSNFGILPDLTEKIRDKKKRNEIYSKIALEAIKEYKMTVMSQN